MFSPRLATLLAALPCFGVAPALSASGTPIPPAASTPVDFHRDIRPLLEEKCIKCHGPEKQRSDLRLDNRAAAMRGATDGPVILPGKSAESRLVASVAGVDEDLTMPPKGERLTAAQVGLIRRWIDDGAPWPESQATEDPARKHWSFQKVNKPALPAAAGLNAVDAFTSARLAEKKLTLSAPADAQTLIRRMTFDLHGLPPTLPEIESFVAAADRDRAAATQNLIERLLASPRYGERWARHWLDVARFAESNGFETNQPRPNAWPYRDYVIRAFNADKPYDHFIREQIAGDALGADDATGFIVAGPWDAVKSPDPVLTANQRAEELHDMVGTTASAFLALTVNCARCHNHKFDPIPQTDYYAMTAIFAGTRHGERAVGDADAAKKAEAESLRPRLAAIGKQLEALEPLADPKATAPGRTAVSSARNSERITPARATQVRFTALETNSGAEPCIDELEIFDAAGRNIALNGKPASSGDYAGNPIHQLKHINDGKYGNGRSWISNTAGRGWVALEFPSSVEISRIVWGRDREEKYKDRTATKYVIELREGDGPWIAVAGSNDRAAKDLPATGPIAKLTAERVELEKRIAALTTPRMVYAGQFGKPADTFRFHRGDPMQPREKVAPGGLSEFGGFQLPIDSPEQERRQALAKWITSPENPLTARVIVNRLWHYHFGTGIVDTPSDFGLNGARPSHPELLDWLASELVEHAWSLKHIHRLILQSATYQQASRYQAQAAAIDGSNRLLWRFPPRRVEAEPLRDAILAVSGKLDLREGGPGFDLFEPNTNYVKVYATKTKFGPDDFRRMVYQAKPRAELDTLFGAFDCPDAGQIQPKRNTSTTPLQALNLLNSSFLLEQSGFFAERLQREAGPAPQAQARQAFELAFGRPAMPEEIAAAEKLIAAHGLPAFCRALYNANEFITIF
jgi:mono/diheme cytochrome c family protein